MTRRFILALALSLAALPLCASSRDAGWRADIQFLATELPRLHVDAFTVISHDAFSAAATQLRDEVPSLSDDEVAVRVHRLVASIGDSHTTVYGYEPPRVPIEVRWLEDGFFVTRAAEMEHDLIGLQLLAIDGHPVEEVVAAVAPIVSHENDAWLREIAPRHLAAPAVLHALGVASSPALAEFRFARADGSTLDRVLTAVTPGSIGWVEALPPERMPLYRRDTERNYWFEYIASSGTLYIAYNRCQEMASPAAAAFSSELAAFARSHPVLRLVLDLRNNGGGNSALVQTLFMETYFALPEVDHPDRFFVIIGPATFSSAMMNAISISDQTQATLIGSETGGKPNHFGNVRTFTLPDSRFTIQYSTTHYTLTPDADPPSLNPDVRVPITSLDYFSGRDPVLDRIAPRFPRRRVAQR